MPDLDNHKLVAAAIILGSAIIAGAILYVGQSIGTKTESVSVAATNQEAGEKDEFPAAQVAIDDDPVLGEIKKARVVIVEFGDYECPYCKTFFMSTHQELKKKYIDTGIAALVYRDFPLPFHQPLALNQAIVGECVQERLGDEKYFQYHDQVFETTKSDGNGMTDEQVRDIAVGLGIDKKWLDKCAGRESLKAEVNNDIEQGVAAGVEGTPGFVVGKLGDDGIVRGRLVPGAYGIEAFDKIISEL